jgi:hypothetical protein
MGWKNAGAHFQQQLAGVLSGLLYKECELYMDDIRPFADSEDEMLQRLHCLFTRFREYNVTLNPENCAIGMDRGGIRRSSDRWGENAFHFIARFEEPNTMFEVKHFLGLANYFREHVPNFSVLAIPLQKLVVGYTKNMRNRKVKLEGAISTFIHLKDLIHRSQKLFYFEIKEGNQIHLKTDVSD